MKSNNLILFFLFLSLSLSGCKVEHNSRIKYSALVADVTSVDANAQIEVPSCTHYQDKTKPSEQLVQTKGMIEKLFPGSEFEGCKMENMNSMASFTIPMEVGFIPDGSGEPKPKGVAILRNSNGEVFFFLSKNICDQINQARKKALSSNLALHVNIKLSNNTDKKITFFPHAVFVDGIAYAGLPRWGNAFEIEAGKSINIKLSDVACEFALAQQVVPIFSEKKESQSDANKK